MFRPSRILIYVIAFAVGCLVTISAQNHTSENGTTFEPVNCDKYVSKNSVIHIGWPFTFSCYQLAKKFGKSLQKVDKTTYDNDNGTCIVQELRNGSILWNSTIAPINWYNYKFINNVYNQAFDNGDPKNFKMIFQLPAANFCSYQELHTEQPPSNETCEIFSNTTVVQTRAVLAGKMVLGCEVPGSVYPEIYIPDHESHLVSYNWTFNCKNDLQDGTVTNVKTLIIPATKFDNIGQYACVVAYKEQKRYVVNYQVCARHASSSSEQYSIQCPDVVEANIGSNITVNCSADLGIGKTSRYYVRSFWKKLNSTGFEEDYCANLVEGYDEVSDMENRSSCLVKSNVNEKCYKYIPPLEEQEPPAARTDVTLKISNVQHSDFGVYRVSFELAGNAPQESLISIVLDEDPNLKHRAIAIGISISLLVLLILLLLICLWRRHDILWFMKKYFGPYEEDTHNYTAYLAYYYSKDADQMNLHSQKQMENLLTGLYETLDSFGATTYDDQREDVINKFQVENISEIQQNCSRIIIILNKEYVTDHWSMHKAYRALQNMVEMGTKMIFITLPGVDKGFGKLENESKATLQHAMKLNITIPWSGKTPLSSAFRRRLEYALPKIKQRNSSERSSQRQLIVYTKNGETRSASQTSVMDIMEK